jgi:hypothetical protein
MANEIKDKFGTLVTLTLTFASLANAAGRVAAQVDNTTVRAGLILVEYNFMTATAPTAGTAVEFYLARGDSEAGAHIDGGLAATDTGYTSGPPTAANLRSRLQLVGVQAVTADANTVYKGSFVISNPGPKWSLYVYNGIGQTLDSTAGNFWVRAIPVTPEVQ